ncbi:phage tail tube protein [Pseudomonas fluorescens]|nr:phage tail tube protein [Pseudomonas fluorescens]
MGRNMWTTDQQEAKSSDATIEVKWEGPSVTEN